MNITKMWTKKGKCKHVIMNKLISGHAYTYSTIILTNNILFNDFSSSSTILYPNKQSTKLARFEAEYIVDIITCELRIVCNVKSNC